MSIDDLLRDCLRDGRLHRLETYNPYIRAVRVIYVSQPVKRFVESPEPRAGYLHLELDSFVEGRLVTASLIPRNADEETNMGLLAPPQDGFWDIRSVEPSPGLRIFGGFIRRDVFVGLVLKERKPLGDFFSRGWANAISECNREWEKRFIAYSPIKGDSVHDFLSNCQCVDSDS